MNTNVTVLNVCGKNQQQTSVHTHTYTDIDVGSV